MIQFNFEKINCCPKKEKKNNSSRGKNPDLPPPRYQISRPLQWSNNDLKSKRCKWTKI